MGRWMRLLVLAKSAVRVVQRCALQPPGFFVHPPLASHVRFRVLRTMVLDMPWSVLPSQAVTQRSIAHTAKC